MATTVQHRMTVEEYLLFIDAAGLDQVELVNGVVYDVSPEGPLHADLASELAYLLQDRYPHLKVRPAGSVRLGDRSLVQPDVYVLDVDRHAPAGSDYPTADLVLLAVEVAVTTRTYDIGTKLAAYALAEVPEYWLVNPKPGGEVSRYTEPAGGAYHQVERVDLPDGAASIGAVRAWLT